MLQLFQLAIIPALLLYASVFLLFLRDRWWPRTEEEPAIPAIYYHHKFRSFRWLVMPIVVFVWFVGLFFYVLIMLPVFCYNACNGLVVGACRGFRQE